LTGLHENFRQHSREVSTSVVVAAVGLTGTTFCWSKCHFEKQHYYH